MKLAPLVNLRPPGPATGVEHGVEVGVGDHGRGIHDGFQVEEGFEEGFGFGLGAIVEDDGHERRLTDWRRGDGEAKYEACLPAAGFRQAVG